MSDYRYAVISRSSDGVSATVKVNGRILYFDDCVSAQEFATEMMRKEFAAECVSKVGDWLYYVTLIKRRK